MNENREALRACPFCNHTDSLYTRHVEGTILHPAYYVECDYCGAQGPTTDKGDHAALWNGKYALAAQRDEPVGVETGWIAWNGGKCPLEEFARVHVRLRSGEEHRDSWARNWDWDHGETCDHIVAYRLAAHGGRESA